MRTVLMILAGFLGAVLVCWLVCGARTMMDFLIVGCAFMLGALVNELVRGEG